MQKNDTIPQYLSKFTQCHDELGGVGVNVPEEDLVSLALLGLPKSWHSYQDSVNGREKLPNWECLWSDLVQEEIRQNTRDGTSSKGEDEEKFALVGKERREKGRNPNPNQNPVKGARRNICPKLNASIVMNSGTMPQSVHTRRKARRPQEEQQVKLWLHSSSLTLPSLHAWPTQ
jgi:hypothetical protein